MGGWVIIFNFNAFEVSMTRIKNVCVCFIFHYNISMHVYTLKSMCSYCHAWWNYLTVNPFPTIFSKGIFKYKFLFLQEQENKIRTPKLENIGVNFFLNYIIDFFLECLLIIPKIIFTSQITVMNSNKVLKFIRSNTFVLASSQKLTKERVQTIDKEFVKDMNLYISFFLFVWSQ